MSIKLDASSQKILHPPGLSTVPPTRAFERFWHVLDEGPLVILVCALEVLVPVASLFGVEHEIKGEEN